MRLGPMVAFSMFAKCCTAELAWTHAVAPSTREELPMRSVGAGRVVGYVLDVWPPTAAKLRKSRVGFAVGVKGCIKQNTAR